MLSNFGTRALRNTVIGTLTVTLDVAGRQVDIGRG